MPRTIEKTIFKFDELTDAAKETARQWWRECENSDFDTEFMCDIFQTVAAILGVEFGTRAVPLMNGKTRTEPRIYWSGFSSQGDGACFEGRYSYAKGAPKAIRAYAPTDTALHAIADALQAAQATAFYSLTATATHSHSNMSHEYSVSIDVTDTRDRDVTDAAAEAITEALRDFCRWMYRQLEKEYEYRMSDENVDESITANEYEFDEEGRLA